MSNTTNETKAAKPTAGPWELTEESANRVSEEKAFNNGLTISMPDAVYSVRMVYGKHTPEQKIANVKVMTEAGTVYHETGLTPRELVEQLNDTDPWIKTDHQLPFEFLGKRIWYYDGYEVTHGYVPESKEVAEKWISNEGITHWKRFYPTPPKS